MWGQPPPAVQPGKARRLVSMRPSSPRSAVVHPKNEDSVLKLCPDTNHFSTANSHLPPMTILPPRV
jgi:hypothetical protein